MIELSIFTSADQAALCATPAQRTIVQRFRNPSRIFAVNVSNDAWTRIAHLDATYRPLVDAVLYSAAQSILKRFIDNAGMVPSSIPASLLSNDAILEEAAGNNSEWLNKEELTEAWKASATRAAIYNAHRYASDKPYQRAFIRFEENILKLAGKTTMLQEKEQDAILAKLADADLNTIFGQFIIRRIEAMKNRKTPTEIDFDVL